MRTRRAAPIGRNIAFALTMIFSISMAGMFSLGHAGARPGAVLIADNTHGGSLQVNSANFKFLKGTRYGNRISKIWIYTTPGVDRLVLEYTIDPNGFSSADIGFAKGHFVGTFRTRQGLQKKFVLRAPQHQSGIFQSGNDPLLLVGRAHLYRNAKVVNGKRLPALKRLDRVEAWMTKRPF
jgi:hypothetical protein